MALSDCLADSHRTVIGRGQSPVIHWTTISRNLQVADTGATPEQQYQHKNARTLIEQALSDLKPKDATLLTLYYLNEQSVKEIADINWPDGKQRKGQTVPPARCPEKCFDKKPKRGSKKFDMITQELFWKYAEGLCDLHETAQVEKLLANDPSLQTDLDSILEAQSALVNIVPEAPSMRFTKNVMEVLPDVYPTEIVAEPLIRPVFKKVFWMALAASLAAVFLLPKTGQSASVGLIAPYIEQLNAGILSTISQVPNMVVQYFILTLLSITLLMVLDKMFLKKVRVLFLV